MKTFTILSLTIAGMFLASSTGQAAKIPIFAGQQERLHALTDVLLQGPNGEALALGFKTSSFFAGLGIYCKDDGYVLTVKNESQRYIPLPPDRVEQWQTAGLLPYPLPTYKVPIWEYIAGYSLWWVLLGAAVYYRLKAHRTRHVVPATPQPAVAR